FGAGDRDRGGRGQRLHKVTTIDVRHGTIPVRKGKSRWANYLYPHEAPIASFSMECGGEPASLPFLSTIHSPLSTTNKRCRATALQRSFICRFRATACR